jgi:predicted amidophosphoribosyltransferase
MPNVKSQTPNTMHILNMRDKRRLSTGLCKQCGAKITFCGRPFTAEIECHKCFSINIFERSQQPVRCVSNANKRT